MPRCEISGVQVEGVVTAVPKTVRRIDDEAGRYGDAGQVARIKKTIGLNERRVVEAGTTTCDLCETAARAVLDADGRPDALLCVTQTPDHFQPSNAAILHGRLGLATNCAAMDIGLGCSGWVYGLWLASQMLAAGGCQRVLLCAGDTLSRCVHPQDRAAAPLFGDAGSATLLVRAETAGPAWFDLHTDGAGAGVMRIPAGAFREPPSDAAGIAAIDEAGNTRRPLDLHMDGAEVFNFSIKTEPPAVQALLEYAGVEPDAVDAFVFHQANRYILTNIARRLKIPAEKVPMETVERYGNQSSASIPGTICDALSDQLCAGPMRLVLSGFGVGLSWASALMTVGPLRTCRVVEH